MPVLNQLECYIKLADSGLRLIEYDTWWGANAVECYVAIPNQPSPFKIQLDCKGYVSPALAAYVYMDGVYQCNRFNKGPLPPEDARTLDDTKMGITLTGKEYYLQGSRQIQQPWRFEKLNVGVLSHTEHSSACRLLTNLNTVAADAVGQVDPHILQNLGVIEVVILRCSIKTNGPVRPASPARPVTPARPLSPVPPSKDSGASEGPRLSTPHRYKVKKDDGTFVVAPRAYHHTHRLSNFAGCFDGSSESREVDESSEDDESNFAGGFDGTNESREIDKSDFAGGFDGPSDSRDDDYRRWQVDGRGVGPARRREGYHRSHPRDTHNYSSHDKAARRSGHRHSNSDDYYGDYYYDTDSSIDDFVPPRHSRSYHRRDDDTPRRSHRHRTPALTPPRSEYRSYPREHDHHRSGRKDREEAERLDDAFRAGLRLGADRAGTSRSGELQRERRRRYRGTSPPPSNIPAGPSVVINQFPGSGQGVQVENVVDPRTGVRYTRVNLLPKQQSHYEFAIESDSDVQDDVYDEPNARSRARELSPTPAPRPRRDTDESLARKIKSLLIEHEKEEQKAEPESGRTSKRSSFHSFVEDAVDEEHGGKPSSGNDKKGEPMDMQQDAGDITDLENFAGKRNTDHSTPMQPADSKTARFPMPGAYPASTPSPILPQAPKGLLEEPKRGFEAAIGRTKAPSPRVYGKVFPPSTPIKADDVSWKDERPESLISSWVQRTQQALFSSLKVEAKGQESANRAAEIDPRPTVSFEERGRARSRQRSPHHDRGMSHDRRRCSVCERYRLHHEREKSREIHIWEEKGNDGWDNNQQSNNGNFSLFTFNTPQPAESKTDQSNWDTNSQNNEQNNWNSNDQQNDWANSSKQNAGWDTSNNQNNSGWGNSNNNDNSWDKSNQNNSGWKNDSQNNNWDSNQNKNIWDTTQNNQANDNTNPWANNPPPPPANWNIQPAEAEKKPDAPKSVGKSHRSKEELESISKPREYWHNLRRQDDAAKETPSTANSSKKRTSEPTGTALPAEPLHTIPESAAKAKNVEHQVCGGEGIETSLQSFSPEYWDSMDKPYMVFRFRYRSRGCLEAILGEKITETTEELRDRLQGLSKEELIEEVVRRKEPGDDDGEKKVESEQREDGAIVPDLKWG